MHFLQLTYYYAIACFQASCHQPLIADSLARNDRTGLHLVIRANHQYSGTATWCTGYALLRD